MKECLQCKNSFKESSAKMKFCSSGCRLKFHRSNPKVIKSESTIHLQTQVLYNAMLDMMTKLAKSAELEAISQKMADKPMSPFKVRNLSPDGSVEGIYVYPPKDIPKNESETSLFPTRFSIVRSFENYQQLKLDCESSESWNELKNEILASRLSSKQKTFLIN